MMKRRPLTLQRLIGTLFGAFCLAALPAVHNAGVSASGLIQQAAVKPAVQTDIASLEDYLNSVRTVRSSFVQTASNGHVAEGTLYLARPGKLRINYKPPAQLQIFGDDFWLIFVDEELKEVNQLPIGATPAALLLRDKIRLSGDIKVQRITRRNGLIRLHLIQTKEPDAGQLIVALAVAPLSLRGWTVVDAQGIETTVTLIAPTINEKIADRVFLFSPPDWANSEPE
jgi:outer membrane lipoprotein-sorting protein